MLLLKEIPSRNRKLCNCNYKVGLRVYFLLKLNHNLKSQPCISILVSSSRLGHTCFLYRCSNLYFNDNFGRLIIWKALSKLKYTSLLGNNLHVFSMLCKYGSKYATAY